MSNTALTTVDYTQLPSTQLATDEQFAALSKAAGFLGRLQLFSKGNAVNLGLIPPGTYGIPESEEKIIKLGPEIDVLPVARRPKALDMSDKGAIIANYDPKSDQFKDIAARSTESESSCMYGTSFLVIERSTGRPLEFFCGSKSTRPIAGEIAPYLPLSEADIAAKAAAGADVSNMKAHGPLPVTLKVRVAKNKKGHTWHVPDVQPCSMPFTSGPPMAVLVEEIDKFLSTKGDGVEVVKEEPGKKTRAR